MAHSLQGEPAVVGAGLVGWLGGLAGLLLKEKFGLGVVGFRLGGVWFLQLAEARPRAGGAVFLAQHTLAALTAVC